VPPEPDAPDPLPRRFWGTGVLTAVAVGLVVFGVMLLSDRGSGDEPPAAGSSTTAAPSGGEPAAADFALTLFDGTRFDLGEHLATDGRPVFLNFWASWCPPCRREMPDISAAAAATPGVQFLGIAVSDDPAAAEAYAGEIDVAYPLGADTTGEIDALYPSPGLPATFLISGDGRIVGTYFGLMAPDVIEDLVAGLLDL
jgi:thiol-disulfide isomerase/thioredoxin